MSPAKKTARKTSKKPPRKPAAGTPRARPAAKKAAPAKPAPAPKKKAAVVAVAPKKAPPAPGVAPKKVAAAPSPAAVPTKKGAAPAPAPGSAPAVRPPAKPEAKRAPGKSRPRPPILPDFVKPGLGGRWECYGCSSKFYDLGKPDPICPKCGADQREKPRDKPTPPPPQPEKPRRAAVPMGSLLDEDEEPVEEFEPEEGDLTGLDAEAFLTESPEEEDEEVEVTPIDEE